jgi:hypothetical protein
LGFEAEGTIEVPGQKRRQNAGNKTGSDSYLISVLFCGSPASYWREKVKMCQHVSLFSDGSQGRGEKWGHVLSIP